MKKAIAVLISAVLLTACGTGEQTTEQSKQSSSSASETVGFDGSILVIDGVEIPFEQGEEAVSQALGDAFAVRDMETFSFPDSADTDKLVLYDAFRDNVAGFDISITNYRLNAPEEHDIRLLGHEGIGITHDEILAEFPDCSVRFMKSADLLFFTDGKPYKYEHTDVQPENDHPKITELYESIESGKTKCAVGVYLFCKANSPCDEILVAVYEKTPEM